MGRLSRAADDPRSPRRSPFSGRKAHSRAHSRPPRAQPSSRPPAVSQQRVEEHRERSHRRAGPAAQILVSAVALQRDPSERHAAQSRPQRDRVGTSARSCGGGAASRSPLLAPAATLRKSHSVAAWREACGESGGRQRAAHQLASHCRPRPRAWHLRTTLSAVALRAARRVPTVCEEGWGRPHSDKRRPRREAPVATRLSLPNGELGAASSSGATHSPPRADAALEQISGVRGGRFRPVTEVE